MLFMVLVLLFIVIDIICYMCVPQKDYICYIWWYTLIPGGGICMLYKYKRDKKSLYSGCSPPDDKTCC